MTGGAAPQLKARMAGLLYLVIMIGGAFGEIFVRGPLIVSGDAVATAHNILASERLYRLGGVSDIATFLCDVAVAALLYELLKPGGRTLAVLAAFFRLVYGAVMGALAVAVFVPLTVLKGGGLIALTAAQREALAYLSLKIHGLGFNIALIFFGLHCLLIGILIARSRFLPFILGILLALAGACYILNSLIDLLAPGHDLSTYLLLPGFIAEASLTLWLLAVGVNVEKWRARASPRTA